LFCAFGAWGIRAVTIPFYATSSEQQIQFMISDAKIRFLFVGEQEQYEKARKVFSMCKTLEKIIVFDPAVHISDDDATAIHFDDFLKMGDDQSMRSEVEKLQKEARQAHEILGVSQSVFLDLPACQLDCMSKPQLNSAFCRVVADVKPEIVLIPHYGDMHLDHRWVAEGAMVAVRPLEAPFVKRVLAYETLSETEWNTPSVNNAFIPNVWVDISGELDGKIKAMECYGSQLHDFPRPRSLKAIKALAEYRGSTIGAEAAEAFILIRGIG
jgi:LmbE family N-acetylglucosaminyl deacetylase